jgi:uncharacterized LabA/DUF88 family protein
MRSDPTSAAGRGTIGPAFRQHSTARRRQRARVLTGEEGTAALAAGPSTTLTDERLKLAVFIDFDNVEIGVKTTLGVHFDIGAILEAIKERGEVITKVAYGDWKRAGDHSRLLTQHAIRMVQRNVTPGGDKNGADINLALDALEMALTHDHINAYVIVGGDSDFISLVEKLKQYDKKVFVVGGRAFTSQIMQKNCYEFIAYENLIEPPPASRRSRGQAAQEKGRPGPLPLGNAVPLVARALQVLSDREVSPQLGLLKSTLLQLDSAFSERNYGARSFRDFVEKLAQAGYVTLRQAGRSLFVEWSEGEAKAARDVAETATAEGSGRPQAERRAAESRQPERRAAEPRAPAAEPESQPAEAAPPAVAPAEGIQAVRRMFEAGLNRARWPLYVRNVKQFLRGMEASFDERRFGFGGILDLLRACQREGIFRLERDRRGVMRVFAGPVLQRAASEQQLETPAAEAGPAIIPDVVAEPAPVVVEAEVLAESVSVEAPETQGAAADVAATGQPAEAPAEGTGTRPRRRRAAAGTRKTTGAPKQAKTTRTRAKAT